MIRSIEAKSKVGAKGGANSHSFVNQVSDVDRKIQEKVSASNLKNPKEAAQSRAIRTTPEDRWRNKVEMSGQPGAKSSVRTTSRVAAAAGVATPGAVAEVRSDAQQVSAGKSAGGSVVRHGRPTTAEDRWRNKVDTKTGGRPPRGRKPGGNEGGASTGKAADNNADSHIMAEIGEDIEEEGEDWPSNRGGSGRRIQAEIGDEAASIDHRHVNARAADPEAHHALAQDNVGRSGGDNGPDFFVDEGRIGIPNEVGGETYIAQLAPDEERDQAVAAMEVKVVDEKKEEEIASGRKFTRRDKAILGAFGLAVVGLGVGLGVGLLSPGPEETCGYRSSWVQEGQDLNRSDVFANHTVNGTLSQLYTAFGSDMTISNDGNRIAVVDRYGDNVGVYERSDGPLGWVQLGSSIRSGEGELSFEVNEWVEEEYNEALAAAVISGDGQRLAVTSPFHSSANISRSGRVRVYELSNNGTSGAWTQVGNDILGEYENAYLGRALTVDLSEDGSTMAVGDYRRNFWTGCVSVYTLNNNNVWTLLGEEICGVEVYDRMGGSVSLSSNGRTIAVGVQGDNGDAGKAEIYQFSDNDQQWALVGDSILPDPGHCKFGWPVSLSADGTRVAVSGSGYLGNISNCYNDTAAFHAADSGDVRVWELREGNWTQMSPAFVGTNDTDGLGWSVSLSGDGSTVAMGASNSDRGGLERGYARAYRYNDADGNWTQVGTDIEGTETEDWTGHAVSLSYNGKRFAVSSPNDYGVPKQKSGIVAVFGNGC